MNSIKVKASSGEECVTASSDGSCIIWDLTTFHRRSSLFANTLFKTVLYHPDESQLVTAGKSCWIHVVQNLSCICCVVDGLFGTVCYFVH